MAETPDSIKTLNQFQIPNTVLIAGSIFRTEITGIISQSRATITNTTAKMIASGLIYENKQEQYNE